jgi:hypothetical protein
MLDYGILGLLRCNLVVAYPEGVSEHWAVITDEPPTLKTLHEYALGFRVEELFLDSKSGAFELQDSRLRNAKSLERLYLVAALTLLYSTAQGMAVQVAGLRSSVDPHWNRGLSYLKIGINWLKGVIHKGRQLLTPIQALPYIPRTLFCFQKNSSRYKLRDMVFSHLFLGVQTLISREHPMNGRNIIIRRQKPYYMVGLKKSICLHWMLPISLPST